MTEKEWENLRAGDLIKHNKSGTVKKIVRWCGKLWATCPNPKDWGEDTLFSLRGMTRFDEWSVVRNNDNNW